MENLEIGENMFTLYWLLKIKREIWDIKDAWIIAEKVLGKEASSQADCWKNQFKKSALRRQMAHNLLISWTQILSLQEVVYSGELTIINRW